jgi:hypothetical protein
MKQLAFLIMTAVGLSACGAESTYTLYRNSITDENMRLHVATFDSSDGDAYNRENCAVAKELFQAQPAVRTKFWCEKGRYRR